MRDRLIFTGQLLFTLLVAAFLVVPAILSISAGVTVNYFRGISSGVTLQWVFQVWDLYAGTILLSFAIAFATLAVTLLAGVPAAYALHVRGGRLSRVVEEIITLPLAIPGLAIALALLLTYGSFGDFRRSWLFILVGHVVFTMPFMVRSVMAPRCASRTAARRLRMARTLSSPRALTSRAAKRWCCSVPPAAARPRCCASSQVSNCLTPGERFCST